eukprot:34580_1
MLTTVRAVLNTRATPALYLVQKKLWSTDVLSNVQVLRKMIHGTIDGLHTNDSHLLDEMRQIQCKLYENIELYSASDTTITEAEQTDCVEELRAIIEELKPIQLKTVLCEPSDQLPVYMHIIAKTAANRPPHALVFAEELLKMFTQYVARHAGNTEIIYRKKESHIKEYIIKCYMNYAYGLLKHEAGYHRKQFIPIDKSLNTKHFDKVAVEVKVFPIVEAIEPHGDLQRFVSDVIVFAELETAREYKSRHKATDISFVNNMENLFWSKDDQIYYAKETLKFKLIEKAFETNHSSFHEVREYTNTKHNRVVNLRTKFQSTQRKPYESVLSGDFEEYVMDHLYYFKKSLTKPLETN